MTNMLELNGFLQHVTEPTHVSGHMLDLIITRESDNIVSSVRIYHGFPPDHFATLCSQSMTKPKSVKQKLTFRKLRQINVNQFQRDIKSSSLITRPASDLEPPVEQYNNVLKELLDKHAPLTQRSITLRPYTPWYDDSLRELKRRKRSCERKWVATRLEVHKQVYREACHDYKLALEQTKSEYHKAQIDDCELGKLFQLVDKMMASKPKKILPAP